MEQQQAPSDAGPQTAEPRASILIVDDHPANLVALEAILAPLGHELVMARSGEEALRHILQREFALILLDVQMADMNGFETAGLIKQHPRSRHIPIIFITAVSRDAVHVFRGYSQGAVDYLVKPFDADILRSKTAVFIELFLRGEKLKLQERMLRERDREVLERKSQERYRRLLDVMPECIWAADASGKVNYWNRPGLAYCGLKLADVREESFWECLHPDDRPEARAHWEAGLRSGASFERQVRIKRAADGSYRWHLARAVPEREPEGHIVGWIATATDIDDQKRAEDALRKAVILRDDFLSVASHELRTPLTSLKLEVANLSRIARRDGAESAPRLIAKVEKIDSQAARLHRLIDELLDVSRIAAGRLELHVELVDLAQIVNEVGVRFTDEAARVGSTLNVHAPNADRRPLGQEPARPGHHQPGLERHQVRRLQADRCLAGKPGRPRRHHHPRSGPGHRPPRSRTHLRPLRTGRVQPPLRRHRPGPVDRQADHRCARWHRVGRKQAGHGIHLHRRTAPARGHDAAPADRGRARAPGCDLCAVVTVDLIIAAAPARMTTSTFTTVLLGC